MNIYSLLAFTSGMICLNLVMFVPFLENLFEIAKLTNYQMGMIYVLAIVPSVLIQIWKIVRARVSKEL